MENTSKNPEVIPSETHSLLKRFLGHLLLNPLSFEYLNPAYLYPLALVVILLIPAIKIGTFFILLHKITFNPEISDIKQYIEGTVFAMILSPMVQIVFWGTIIYVALRVLKGKGKYTQTLSLFALSYSVVVIGSIFLLIIAAFQPCVVVDTTVENFHIASAFGAFWGFNIANMVVVTTTYLYAHIITGVALSVEHRVPQSICFAISLIVYVLIMITFWLL